MHTHLNTDLNKIGNICQDLGTYCKDWIPLFLEIITVRSYCILPSVYVNFSVNLRCVAVRYSGLQRVAMCCSMLQSILPRILFVFSCLCTSTYFSYFWSRASPSAQTAFT